MADAIQIDGKAYPLATADQRTSPWSLVERGEKVEWERRFGFLGGMGAYVSRRGDDYLLTRQMEAVSFPYLRLRPRATSITLTGLNSNLPVYGFVEQDGSANAYGYILSGQYAYKIRFSDNTSGTRQDFGAGARVGRPAFFKGKWHIPLGDSVDYVTLDTIAVGNSASADTWTTVTGQKALHFAIIQKTTAQMLARAYSDNLIDLSANGTSWQGDDFEVPTETISDLLSASGDLVISSAQSIFLMDDLGRAVPILQTFATALSNKEVGAATLGANSWQHGGYTYWPHSSGVWRFIGQQAQAIISPDADEQHFDRTLDSFDPFPTPSVQPGGKTWRSVAATGKWIYATYTDKLFTGLIEPDGTVLWHGVVWDEVEPALGIRCVITEGSSATVPPRLWIARDGAVRLITLKADGSFKVSGGRGAVSTTFQAWLPEVRGPRRTQWRVMWAELEGDQGAEQPVQLAAHMDGAATSTNIGATITATGRTERAWTVGTSDRANFILPTVKITTTASYDTADDPRIRALGGWGLAPQVYRAVIDLRQKTLAERGQQWDVRGALKTLRDMVNGVAVTIIEPETEESFSGYIEAIEEQVREDGFIVSVLIQMYDWYGSA